MKHLLIASMALIGLLSLIAPELVTAAFAAVPREYHGIASLLIGVAIAATAISVFKMAKYSGGAA